MKTQRKNKNKLTKRSNKKNKQNKKTQKRKQSGGNTPNVLRNAHRTLTRASKHAIMSLVGIKCKNNVDDCKDYINTKTSQYEKEALRLKPELREGYIRMKLCNHIGRLKSNLKNQSSEVKYYLNDLFEEEVCKITSQKSKRHTQRSRTPINAINFLN